MRARVVLPAYLALVAGLSGCALLPPMDNPDYSSPDFEDRAPATDPYDVELGMRPQEVLRAWGEPATVEYAGERASGNQRWIYPEGLLRSSGLRNARVLYFEGGVLVGWERSALR